MIRSIALIIFIISLVFVLLIGGTIPYYLFYIFALLLLLPLLHSLIVLRGLRGHVEVPEGSLFPGDKIEIKYTVINNSYLPIPYLEIENSISQKLSGILMPNVKLTLKKKSEYTHNEDIVLGRRGFYEVGEINVIIRDIFGFYTLSKSIVTDTSLLVYPKNIKISNFNIVSSYQIGELYINDLSYEDKSRISSIREYREGDNIKSIHWKLSAKRDLTMIKEFEKRGDSNIVVFIDNKKSLYKVDVDRRLEDKAVEVALGILDYSLNQNLQTSLEIQDVKSPLVIRGDDASSIKPFLEALAKFKANGYSSLKDIIDSKINNFHNNATVIIIGPCLNNSMGSIILDLKYKRFNPILILITDIENNVNLVDKRVHERLMQEFIPIYILDHTTNTKAALEVHYGYDKG